MLHRKQPDYTGEGRNLEIGDEKTLSSEGIKNYNNKNSDDHFSSLIADRLKDEALEEHEDSVLGDEYVSKSLLLPPELAEQIYSDVNACWTSKIIPEFELEHIGIRIVSVRKSMRKLQKNHVKSKADSLSWRIEE